MMMKQILLSLFGVLFALQTQAQHKISGTVSDAAGRPLSGAAVSVKESPTFGTVTDAKGHYELSLPDGTYRISVSFVGYDPSTGDDNMGGNFVASGKKVTEENGIYTVA